MKTIRMLTLAVAIVLSGCAEVMQIAQQTLAGEAPLTQNEIVAGLKEALITGTNNSVDILGAQDGYYKDELVKILLPPEADMIVDNVGKVPGGQKLLDDVLLHINRAAEDAAKEAAPIFVNSIKSMTFNDAVGILKGNDNAATSYLHKTTYDQLFALYRPKIKSSVEKELVGGVSTKESWDTLVGKWNQVAGSFLGQTAGLKKVDTQLEDYLTAKALDGVFLKIAGEEKLIREDPAARVTSLLKKVFGSVDS
ncbi:Protein of unknown function [Draconibacterium orientale]|uniref:DUF4197 domain-containing protein n=1 Tax=Draconibacterium orientale TaxID=1168034 RepID=X5DX87_9BACT|nr:DUF4197 domain-containing protein [Draconibacterium orientale]AHW58876.1 hypothetical protein FH5T_02765 [Draconibacterium orientale]SEU04601.1 Protein of unknown function [Draconibacterium orientale]